MKESFDLKINLVLIPTFLKMYLLLIFLSIIGSCFAGFFGRYLGSHGSAIITTSCLFLSFLISLFVFYEVALIGCFVYIKLTIWVSSEVLNVDWGFMFECAMGLFILCLYVDKIRKKDKLRLFFKTFNAILFVLVSFI